GFRDYRYTHDRDFALRASLTGRCRSLPQFLTAYRVHGSHTIPDSEEATRGAAPRLLRELLRERPQLREGAACVAGLRNSHYLGPEWLAEEALASEGSPRS